MTRRILAFPDKTEWVGGCSVCNERPDKIIVVHINEGWTSRISWSTLWCWVLFEVSREVAKWWRG